MKGNLVKLKNAAIPERERESDIVEQPILEIRDVSVVFDGLVAVNKVSFSVHHGDIIAIVGPNGAGKSTLLKLITGLLPLSKGEIWFKQQRLDRLAPHRIASLGITQVFQDVQLFSNMSVIENVMVGCHVWTGADFLSTGLRLAQAKAEEGNILETAMGKLSLVGLEQKAFAAPSSLSWGQQKLLGLARALAAGSELLLLDEPYGGLITDEIEKLSQLILGLQRQGITILMVEQLTAVAMSIANRVIVLSYGEEIAEGTPYEIQNNEQVIATYLGDGLAGK